MALLATNRLRNGVTSEPELPPGVKVELVLVTPEIAGEWLKMNTRNRPIASRTTEQYQRDMETDNWLFTGDPIQFSRDGKLHNAQHRLLACVRSGIPFLAVVVTGLDNKVQHVIDRGRKRTLGDDFAIDGVPNNTSVAAAVRIICNLRRDGGKWATTTFQGGIPRTSPELHAEFEKDREGFIFAGSQGVRAGRLGSPGLAAGMFYGFAEHDVDDAVAFFDRVADPSLITAGESNAPLLLHLKLAESRAQPKLRTAPTLLGAWWLKAFNGWRSGERMAVLKWRPGGARPEAFPQIEPVD